MKKSIFIHKGGVAYETNVTNNISCGYLPQ